MKNTINSLLQWSKKIPCRYLVTAAFILGVCSGPISMRLFPPNFHPPHRKIDILMDADEVASLIHLQTVEDVETRRTELAHYVWGKSGFPSQLMPSSIEQAVVKTPYDNLKNVTRIDRGVLEMELGFDIVFYLLWPKNIQDTAIIFHAGHLPIFEIEHFDAILSRGFPLAVLTMPLYGENNQPVVETSKFGRLQITNHVQLSLVDLPEGSPLQFFLSPVAAVVNHLEKTEVRKICMIGYSGGGWTSTISAALDERILCSYPVAGTAPFFLREPNLERWGHYENSHPAFYRIANYMELYVMGGMGVQRRQIQILNTYDPMFFPPTYAHHYENVVQQKINSMSSGTFFVYRDDTHSTHKFSRHALDYILSDIESQYVAQ